MNQLELGLRETPDSENDIETFVPRCISVGELRIIENHHENCSCSDCYFEYLLENGWGGWNEGIISEDVLIKEYEKYDKDDDEDEGDDEEDGSESYKRSGLDIFPYYTRDLATEICSLVNRFVNDFGYPYRDLDIEFAISIAEEAFKESCSLHRIQWLKETILEFLKTNKTATLKEIEEHTDSRYGDELGKALSQLLEKGNISIYTFRRERKYKYVKED